MRKFIVRVELKGASDEIYSRLDQSMIDYNFTLEIKGDSDNAMYMLPRAEYYYEGNLTLSEVSAEAFRAAVVVYTQCSLIAAEIVDYECRMLTPA